MEFYVIVDRHLIIQYVGFIIVADEVIRVRFKTDFLLFTSWYRIWQ